LRRNCSGFAYSGKLYLTVKRKDLFASGEKIKKRTVMLSQTTPPSKIFTVSALNRMARTILESEIGQLWISAEISNFVAASSGHWYFTLKDERAQVRTAMFKNSNRRVQIRPKDGDKVLIRASISLYEPRGEYQLIAEHMESEGEGLLKQQFEQLKNKLAAEGLFAQQYKKTLPKLITRVGVITSSTGAALHDILTVLKRRNPAISVILYPSQVQGEAASQQICDAIHTANHRNEVDVLIVGRGGGSLEDLWCFNQESVARAIFACTIPVISAVGHEIDVSIADFVADVRAATPSAAAELVSGDVAEYLQRIDSLLARVRQLSQSRIKALVYQQQVLDQRLQRLHPKNQLRQQSQYLDQLTANLATSMQTQIRRDKHALDNSVGRLALCSPKSLIANKQISTENLHNRLISSWQAMLNKKQQQLANNSQLLNTVSPLATLARGYNIGFKQGQIVKSVQQLKTGDVFTSRFCDGEVSSKVMEQ
jgi:exodeoxyribonuclease VII large subunit